jgi:hypothetical protein
MLRGLPHLVKYMPEAKDARRLIPDPENEPDFERIRKAFPLPDTQAGMLELALALAARNAGASIVAGHGLQQLQGATTNNWASSYTGAPSMGTGGIAGMLPSRINRIVFVPQQRSIPSMLPLASALEAAQSHAAMRGNDAVAAAVRLEADLAAQDQQNVALLVELTARRQLAEFAARRQQANSGNASFAASVESMLQPPSNLSGYNF